MITDPPFAALVCPAHRTGALSAWSVRMRVPKSAARIALRTIALLLPLSFLFVSTARAQLPYYPAGFTPSGLTLNGSAALSGTRLRLTNGGAGQAGSAFFNARVNVQSFVTDFSFQLTNATADGFTFTIQGNSAAALGWNGGCLGYGSTTGTGSMGNSVAVGFQLYSTELGNIKVSLTGDWTNGSCPSATPGSDMSASGVNLHSGDKMTVHMTYDGTTLTWKVTDTVTGKSFTKSVAINIPSYVGGNTAYVGFTGGTGGLSATQDILNWTFTVGGVNFGSGFTSWGLTLNGGPTISGTNLVLTNGGTGEARSAFFNTKVNVQSFANDFTFQLINATADGFTFTIQGNSAAALGGAGGSLGYGPASGNAVGIPNSVAVGFQLYSTKLGNIKVSLTGDWTNGVSPAATPGSDMSASGVNLHSGDKMTVHMTYDGATLTWKVTDTVTGKSFTKSVAINIPSYVGGNTAYVGFTGGTGGLSATQDILNWTYSPNVSASPDFSFSASPSTESVAAGLQASYAVTITPQNGFTGSVGLSTGILPSGVTASFNPASITGSGTSTFTVFTPCSSSDSTSTLTLTGTSGSLSHSMLATLTVSGDPNCQAALLVVNPLNSSLDNIATELHGMPIQDSQPAPQSVAGMSSPYIPQFNLTNGPAGVTQGGPGHGWQNGSWVPATALPAPILLAATWDTSLANQYGTVLGVEARALANGLIKAPDVDIARTLQNGRTFESFGEDPYLTSQIAIGEIQGIQSQNVIAEPKHFVANNQETDRWIVNEKIDKRTLREIYLPAFEAATTQGGVGAVMCAYNQVTVTNGPAGAADFMCQNSYLLSLLKYQWGFNGFVQSDYGATHSTVASANAGLDLEMATGTYFVTKNSSGAACCLQTAVNNGQVAMETLDDKLMRRFQTMMQFNIWNSPPVFTGISSSLASTDAGIAQQIAEQGMVLLKNAGNILPIKPAALAKKNIALIGPYAGAAMTGGGGSSYVTPISANVVSPLTGIKNWLVSHGFDTFTVSYRVGTESDVATVAAAADVAIVMVGDAEFENYDDSISLSADPLVPPFVDFSNPNDSSNYRVQVDQNNLVSSVLKAQPNTIVVVKSGTGLLMPWCAGVAQCAGANTVPGVLQAWYPGEADGNAVARVLFGDVNPSGKLPLTIPVSAADPNPPANEFINAAQYPGLNQSGAACTKRVADGGVDTSCTATYSEGVFVGYRYYDQSNITPLFPFGFGLSYTTFSFQNLVVSPGSFTFAGNPSQTVTVTFDVKNTGGLSGAEVAQVYVGWPSSPPVPEPPRQLKGFRKITLSAGQTQTVSITLSLRSFAYWDVNTDTWVVAPGTYPIMVGDSSRNTVLQGEVTIY